LIHIDDLKPRGISNVIIKFADDTTLLVPENCDVTAGTEIKHVQELASQNKMSLNLSKTKEIVFRRPNIRLENIPNDICGVERLECVKLLGLYINSVVSSTC